MKKLAHNASDAPSMFTAEHDEIDTIDHADLRKIGAKVNDIIVIMRDGGPIGSRYVRAVSDGRKKVLTADCAVARGTIVYKQHKVPKKQVDDPVLPPVPTFDQWQHT